MGKFDFVNTKLEMNRKGLTGFSREKEVKQNALKKKKYIGVGVIILFLFAALSIYLIEGHSVKKEGTAAPAAAPIKKVVDKGSTEKTTVMPGLEKGFKPEEVKNGSTADYQLHLKMEADNKFEVKAGIKVGNVSANVWKDLVFYFWPNMLANPDSESCFNYTSSRFDEKCLKAIEGGKTIVQTVKVNGRPVTFLLNEDTLRVPLSQQLVPGGNTIVEVNYTFSLPEISREGNNIFLAEWYPMLATYDNDWKKQPYFSEVDTYLTSHSNYVVHYELPKEYTLLSSSDTDSGKASRNGEIKGTKIKEMFLGLMKNTDIKEAKVNHVNIRVAAGPNSQHLLDSALKTATNAVAFFEEKIGAFPQNQLDIVLVEGDNKEYPGVVKVSMTEEANGTLDHTIVHQIAHQWFYETVNNDRYFDGWLDEGFTELSTSLFCLAYEKKSEENSFAFPKRYFDLVQTRPARKSNLPISNYTDRVGNLPGFLNGQPTMQLWKLIKTYGGEETALKFLSDYYKTYSYKQVTTNEFVRFASSYFNTDDTIFADWLSFTTSNENQAHNEYPLL